jgi:hypothetical protein
MLLGCCNETTLCKILLSRFAKVVNAKVVGADRDSTLPTYPVFPLTVAVRLINEGIDTIS